MTELIKSLLKKHKRKVPWLAIELDMPKVSLNYKLKHGSWSFKDWLKIIEVFELSDTEILELAKGEKK